MSGNLDFINKEEVVLSTFEPLPVGEYIAMVTSSTLNDTKSGSGKKLDVVFTIFQEPYAGREIKHNFNVKNDSAKAQEIGLGQLKRCALACGLDDIPDDSQDLHDKPLKLKLDIEPYTYQDKQTGETKNGASNKVKGYYSMDKAKGVEAVAKATAAVDDEIDFFA